MSFGGGDPPRPSGLPEDLGAGPEFTGPSPAQEELLQFQLGRMKKAAKIQDATIVALETLYGRPFAEEYANQIKQYTDLQESLIGEQQGGVESRKLIGTEYETATGLRPEVAFAEQGAREQRAAEETFQDYLAGIGRQREIAGTEFARWRKAAAGEADFDPALGAAITKAYSDLDAEMRQRVGPGWELSSAGAARKSALDRSVATTIYNASRAEMNAALPQATYGGTGLLQAVYAPSPTLNNLLASKTTLNPGVVSTASPIQVGNTILGYAGPSDQGTGLLQALNAQQNAQNQFNLGRFNTQAGLFNQYAQGTNAANAATGASNSALAGAGIGAAALIGAAFI